MSRQLVRTTLAIFLISSFATAHSADLETGTWSAWLDCDDGHGLMFGLHIERTDNGLEAWLLNGDERSPISRIVQNDREVSFEIDHFTAGLLGTVNDSGTRLEGYWFRVFSEDFRARLPFQAVAPSLVKTGTTHASSDPLNANASVPRFSGRWGVKLALRPDSSVAIFAQASDGTLKGTFIHAGGDARHLTGNVIDNRLFLSRFDGAHAFLYEATLGTDDSIRGEFWEGSYIHDSWTGRRDPGARVVDPFAQLDWQGPLDLPSLIFPDVNGRMWSLADQEFAGKAIIIEILGTWCPNCHDSTEYLIELHQRYQSRGLSIIGLAFELVPNFEHNAAQVRRYVESFEVPYPVLLASKGSLVKPPDVFPNIRGHFAIPAILFLYPDGRLRAIHSGFTGPAAEEAYEQLQGDFEDLVLEILNTP